MFVASIDATPETGARSVARAHSLYENQRHHQLEML